MTDISDTWPEPRYEVGPRKHLHALGVVAANYNVLEHALVAFLLRYTELGNVVTQLLFSHTSNHLRLDLLRACVEERERDPTVRELAFHFAACFDVCAQNRNVLMHSSIAASAHDPDILNLAKRSRSVPARTNILNLKLEAIRGVADEIHTIAQFGFGVHTWLILRTHGGSVNLGNYVFAPTLPEKPPLPSKLSTPSPQA